MSDCIVTVNENGTTLVEPVEPIIQTIPNELIVKVIPEFTEGNPSVTILVQPTEVVIQPVSITPTIHKSFGVQDLYLLVIDIELLEAWQNRLNDLVARLVNYEQLVNQVAQNTTLLQTHVQEILTIQQQLDINTDQIEVNRLQILANIEILETHTQQIADLIQQYNDAIIQINLNKYNIEQLQNKLTDYDNLVQQVAINKQDIIDLWALLENYTTIEDLVNAHVLHFTSIDTDIHDLKQYDITLNSHLLLNDGLIEANTSLIQTNKTEITQYIDGKIALISQSILTLSGRLDNTEAGISANSELINDRRIEIITERDRITALAARTTSLESSVGNFNDELAALSSAQSGLITVAQLEDGVASALAGQALELKAEIPAVFSPKILWDFLTGSEGWVGYGASLTTPIPGFIQVHTTETTQYIYCTLPEPIAGAEIPAISITWRAVIDASVFDGEVYYQYDGGGSTWYSAGTFHHVLGINQTEHDVIRPRTVDANYENRTITGIRIGFGSLGTYEVDSIALGTENGLGVYSYIYEHAVSWVTEDGAFATSVKNVAVNYTTPDGTTATATLNDVSDLVAKDGIATASKVTILTARVDNTETSINGNATAINSLDTRVENTEDGLVSTASDITNLQTSVQTNTTNLNAEITNRQVAITTETNARVSADQTLQTNINGVSASIHTTSEIEQLADGRIDANWAVEIDANGHISGFYLNSSTTTSYMQFLVDKFYVTDGTTTVVPFRIENQIVYMQNIVVQNAQIENAAITTLKLGDAAVLTGKIGTGAVSGTVSTTGTTPSISGFWIYLTTQAYGHKVMLTCNIMGKIVPDTGNVNVTVGQLKAELYRYNGSSYIALNSDQTQYTNVTTSVDWSDGEGGVGYTGYNILSATFIDSSPLSNSITGGNDSYAIWVTFIKTFGSGTLSIPSYTAFAIGLKR